MAVFGYVRVSTDRQADEGQSLGAQQRVIQGYAMQQGWTVDEIFVECGVSGSTPLAERPQGQRLLTRLAAGDIVITSKLDRMFRSALNALEVLQQLQARGVSLHMIDLGGDVTGNGVSRLFFTILSAVAEAERDRIRERIRDVKRDQAKRGHFLGGWRTPFGWRLGAQLLHCRDRGLFGRLLDQGLAVRAERASYDTIAKRIGEAHGFELRGRQVNRILNRETRS